jgi:hypothetical protein
MIFKSYLDAFLLDKRERKGLASRFRKSGLGLEVLEKRDLPAGSFVSSHLAVFPAASSSNDSAHLRFTPVLFQELPGMPSIQDSGPSASVLLRSNIEGRNATPSDCVVMGQQGPPLQTDIGIAGDMPLAFWASPENGMLGDPGSEQVAAGGPHLESAQIPPDCSWSAMIGSIYEAGPGQISKMCQAFTGDKSDQMVNHTLSPTSVASGLTAVQMSMAETSGGKETLVSTTSVIPLINGGTSVVTTKPVLTLLDLALTGSRFQTDSTGNLKHDFAPGLQVIQDQVESEYQSRVNETGTAESRLGEILESPWLAEFMTPVLNRTSSAPIQLIQQFTGPTADVASGLRDDLTLVFSSPWFISTMAFLAGAEICRRRYWQSMAKFNQVIAAPEIDGPMELLEYHDYT